MNRSVIDIFVGLFVVLGFAALLFLALQAANLTSFSSGATYDVTARFDNIGGLKVRAPIKSAGVTVGRVADIGFNSETFQASVTLAIQEKYKFPKDSSAKILTSGLLGEQYLGLEPGGDEKNLAAGDRLSLTQSAVVLENLIGQFLYGRSDDGGDKKMITLTRVAAFAAVARLLRFGLFGLMLAIAAGCSTTGSNSDDPYESFNRKMYSFNESLDNNVLQPTAKAYTKFVPQLFRDVTRNFFSNIDDLFIGVNNLLQGKPRAALTDWTRVLLNSTFGFFGVSDPASEMGWDKHREDFGQTLGVWGLPSGPYLVLPLFGPSSIRGTTGVFAGYWADPSSYLIEGKLRRTGLAGLRIVDTRARLLGASNLLQGAALDEYSFVRDAYKQRRRNQIYDGNPPMQKEDPEDAPYDPKNDPDLNGGEQTG